MRTTAILLSVLLAATAVVLVAPAASAREMACSALLDATSCPWTICIEPTQWDAYGRVTDCEYGIYGYPCQYCKPLE